MKLPSLLVLTLLVTTLLCPPPALTQELGIGVAQSSPAGPYHALVIGNNAYTSLPRLKTAESDAREVAALLKEYYGFQTKLLLNATRRQIMSALNTYRRDGD